MFRNRHSWMERLGVRRSHRRRSGIAPKRSLFGSVANLVVSLDSVDEYEQTISENTRCTLLMYDAQSSSGESHGFNHMLLSSPVMHALRQTRLRRASGPLWSRSWHSSTAVHHVSGHVFGAPGHGVLRCARRGPNDTIAMRALAEGNSLRGTGRIVDVDKDTICDWLDRAGRHCRAVTTYLFDTLHITECQVDE